MNDQATAVVAPESLDLKAASVQAKHLPAVEIVAYTGGAMTVPQWGVIAIDLNGLELGTVPILADHESTRSGVVGHGMAQIRDGKVIVSGSVSATTEAAQQVVAAAKNGFPWQASVGVQVIEQEAVRPGERVQVNGRLIVAPKTGLTVIRKGKLKEVSITSLGCDGGTVVSIAASRRLSERESMEPEVLEVDEQTIRADERERLQQIENACRRPRGGWGAMQSRVDDIRAAAIAGQVSMQDLSNEMLNIIRESRPRMSPVYGVTQVASIVSLEAALLKRMGRAALGEKTLGPVAMGHGERLRATHTLDLCRAALAIDGRDIPSSRDEMVRAALSTYSLPTALSNIASKLLLDAYQEAPATWRAFCSVRSVVDFKPSKAIRPSFTGSLEQVAHGGELKHGQVGEWSGEFKADTFGKLLSIDRRDIINDDLGLFDETAMALGRMAMRKVSDLVYETLLANGGSFFAEANGNYLEGADSALSFDSLAAAIQLMLLQRDEEGNDLDLRPATLLVAPELQPTAKALLESEYIQRIAELPTGNSLRQAVTLQTDPRLSNTIKFGNQASAKHWYLFASPINAPMVVAFLQGKQEPTVEYYGLNQDINTLAVSWRVYHDFGAALVDPRAAVRAKGQA